VNGNGKKKRRKWIIYGGIVVAIVLVCVIAVWAITRGGNKIDPSKLAKVEQGDLAKSVVATGKVEPITKVEVKSKASGIVKKLLVDYGDRVKKGQLLAQLDKEEIQAQVDQSSAGLAAAESSLKAAEADYERAKVDAQGPEVPLLKRAYERAMGMAKEGVVSTSALEEAQKNYELALNKQNVSKAQLTVLKAKIAQSQAQVAQDRANLKQLEEQLPQELKPYDKPIRVRELAPKGTLGKSGKLVKYIHVPGVERVTPWSSPKVVADYLYGTLQLPEQFHPKTKKLTTDKDALERLFRKTKNPDLDILRKVNSLSTIISGFLQDDDSHSISQGMTHANFLPHGTSTGRLSSSEPNMQNITPKAKHIYVPNHPDWCWIEADFSSLENTLAAYFANDEDRLRRMNEPGFNEHKWLANQIYGIPIAEIDKAGWQYDRAKHTNHGADAGMGPKMMAMKYNVPEKDCRDLLLMWKKLNWKSVQWQERTGNQGIKDGVLRNPFSRKRWLWSQKAYTEGLRFILQGTGADICIRSMIALMYERINWSEENVLKVSSVLAPLPRPATLNVQVHDSLLCSSPFGLVDKCIEQMGKAMMQPWKELGGFKFNIAFKVGNPGASWGELHEVK